MPFFTSDHESRSWLWVAMGARVLVAWIRKRRAGRKIGLGASRTRD